MSVNELNAILQSITIEQVCVVLALLLICSICDLIFSLACFAFQKAREAKEFRKYLKSKGEYNALTKNN